MIVLVLFLISSGAVSAHQDHQYPDYFAVRTNDYGYGYKVFTRRIDCTDPVYVYDDDRVLLKMDDKWIIGKLDIDTLPAMFLQSLPCNSLTHSLCFD